MIIYELKRNYEESGGFSLHLSPEKSADIYSILSLSNAYKGLTLPDNAISDEFRVFPNNYGKKNFKFDFHFEGNIFILSESIYKILYPVLSSRGNFFRIKTDSKKKKYIGYHLTNIIDCLDLDGSDYIRYKNGIVIRKPTLFSQKITDKYIFQIKEDPFRVFVTNELKKLFDNNNILDIDFGSHNIVNLVS